MEKLVKSVTPSKIPKASCIPRPRSKSRERCGPTRSQSFSQSSETRSKSAPAPREVSTMSERQYAHQPPLQEDDDEDRYDHQHNNESNSHPGYDNNNYSNLPNNIPRYQGLINSKFRQGILTNQHGSHLESKSEYTSNVRNGNPVLRDSHQKQPEDIASMFQRPNSIRHPASSPLPLSTGWGRTEISQPSSPLINGYEKDSGWSNPARIKELQPIMSPNNNSTIGFKNSYSTPEELDNILAKYKSGPQQPQPLNREQVYQVYQQSTVQPNYSHLEHSKYQNQLSSNEEYHSRESHVVKSKQFDQNQRQHNDPIAPLLAQPKENLGVFGLPLESVNYKQKLSSLKKGEDTKLTGKHPKQNHHKFPFKENADGDLLVHPDQVAFESKTVSVLVSDPIKMWSRKTEKVHDLRNQELLMKEVETVIHKGLNRFYDAGQSLSDDDDHNGKRSMNNDNHHNKEIMIMKYSDAKTGTEKLMSDIHHRLRSGRNADTHIIIGEKIYPCHSVALEVVSKFFDSMTRPKDSLRQVELPDSEVPATVFPTLMDWILQNDHGRAAVMNKGNVVSLFSCGKYLDISELKSQCVNYLQEKVETNDRHLMALWEEVKKRPTCHELMVVISAKAALSFQHIFKERKFLNLDVDELVMLLSSDDIVIESELDVFDTAVQWLVHNWETRKVFTNEVINTVRFGLLTPLQLTQIAHSPELAKGATFPHEYPELLAYGSVKAMIDDGLAYSIVFESYKAQPDQIKKWVESTGIKAPRPRNHTNPTGKNKTFTIPHDATPTTRKSGIGLERRPSYTVFKTDHPMDESLCKTSTKTNESSRTNKPSVLDIFENAVTESRGRSREGRSTKMEAVVNLLGQPIKDEDIQSLGPSTMGRTRSLSRDKYQ